MHGNDLFYNVIEALAAADGVEISDLDYQLHDYIDPAVLTKLGAVDGGIWEFRFQVADHQVMVTHDGRILVDGVVQETEASVGH